MEEEYREPEEGFLEETFMPQLFWFTDQIETVDEEPYESASFDEFLYDDFMAQDYVFQTDDLTVDEEPSYYGLYKGYDTLYQEDNDEFYGSTSEVPQLQFHEHLPQPKSIVAEALERRRKEKEGEITSHSSTYEPFFKPLKTRDTPKKIKTKTEKKAKEREVPQEPHEDNEIHRPPTFEGDHISASTSDVEIKETEFYPPTQEEQDKSFVDEVHSHAFATSTVEEDDEQVEKTDVLTVLTDEPKFYTAIFEEENEHLHEGGQLYGECTLTSLPIEEPDLESLNIQTILGFALQKKGKRKKSKTQDRKPYEFDVEGTSYEQVPYRPDETVEEGARHTFNIPSPEQSEEPLEEGDFYGECTMLAFPPNEPEPPVYVESILGSALKKRRMTKAAIAKARGDDHRESYSECTSYSVTEEGSKSYIEEGVQMYHDPAFYATTLEEQQDEPLDEGNQFYGECTLQDLPPVPETEAPVVESILGSALKRRAKSKSKKLQK